MGAAKDSLNKSLGFQDYMTQRYGPQFGDIALWYAQNNPAASMFDPSWYYNAENQSQAGMNGAQTAQDKLGAQADRFDQFAQGAGAQMEPGLQRQDDQAQWLWEHPGYTDQEKRSMDIAATSPIAGAYADAAGQMRGQVARTGNSAGFNSAQADLARSKARDLNMAAINNQTLFGNARMQGQQFANQATGAANQNRQNALNLQGNLFNTGANMRLGEAGSRLESAKTAQGAEGVMQNAQNLSMEPGRLAANMFGTVQNGNTSTFNPRQQQASQPSFLKSLALSGIGGLAQGASKLIPGT